MARADRLARLDAQREEREAEYRTLLIAALERAAAGSWGLFAHTADKARKAAWEPAVTELCDLGAEIDDMRERLGLEPFALHHEFEASRGPVPSTAPGEPRQAKAWLERLARQA